MINKETQFPLQPISLKTQRNILRACSNLPIFQKQKLFLTNSPNNITVLKPKVKMNMEATS